MLALERLLIVVASASYLVMFNQTVPHGDALRIVRQIEAGDLIWNPNHLIFDPLGYGLYHALAHWLPNVTALGVFEVISALATVASLLVFHAVLVRSGVSGAGARAAAVLALFASASFTYVAVSQYYFMVQMPLLLAALYFYLDFLIDGRAGLTRTYRVYAMGIVLGLATAVMFNNLLFVLASGIGVALVHRNWRSLSWQNTVRLYLAAAAVGFPIFLVGYYLADVESNIFQWLLSYEGNADSQLNQLYGANWTFSEVLRGTAMVGFNMLVGCFVDPAGLGTVLSVIVFREAFEFIPMWDRIVLSLVAVPAVVAMNIWIANFALRRMRTEPVVRFLSLWILAFVLFNFLWNVGDEIFWFQIVPAVWMLLLTSQRALPAAMVDTEADGCASRLDTRRTALLGTLGCLLLVVNTMNAVAPGADRDFQAKQSQHAAMLRDGDLEIIPGWDQQKWMMLPDGAASVDRLLLMNLAVAALGSDERMAGLPEMIRNRLDRGHRVIVARVFDLDHDLMPWYSLRGIGWPRERVQSLFDKFCNRPLAVIGDVVFRVVVSCDKIDDPELAGEA